MSIATRVIRPSISITKAFGSYSRNIYFTAVRMNSSQATYNPSHENGKQNIVPKQMGALQNLKLNDGTEIPMLAYGLGSARYKPASKGASIDREIVEHVKMAIDAGFYHLDGAQIYNNEAELGLGIKESKIDRAKLFVVTKISGTEVLDTQKTFDESLKKLQLEYVDLYLIHAAYFANGDKKALQQKWADMEAILASGKAKSIGVSNFLQPDLEAILETAKVIPSINQIEFHPYLQHGDLVPWMTSKGIATSAYSPLTAVTKAKPGPLDETYKDLAHKYGVGEGEIALRWCIDQGIVALTTSAKRDRLERALKVFEFKLTPKEVDTIKQKGLEKHFRVFWNDKIAKDDRS